MNDEKNIKNKKEKREKKKEKKRRKMKKMKKMKKKTWQLKKTFFVPWALKESPLGQENDTKESPSTYKHCIQMINTKSSTKLIKWQRYIQNKKSACSLD